MTAKPTLEEDLATHSPLILCEGSAERIIMETLLDAGMLIIDKDSAVPDLATGRPTVQRGKPDNLARDYLQTDEDIVIIRIIDSLKEGKSSPVPKAYADRTPVHTFYTRDEIEMLMVIREGHFQQFKKWKGKPSEYCKKSLGFGKQIKSEQFLRDYWRDPETIRQALLEYQRLHRFEQDERSIFDLLRPNFQR